MPRCALRIRAEGVAARARGHDVATFLTPIGNNARIGSLRRRSIASMDWGEEHEGDWLPCGRGFGCGLARCVG
jgi:hypothetical protein